MNKLYIKILKKPIIIILFICLFISQFISTNIIREASTLEFRVIYFSALDSFYKYGLFFSYFLILKFMLITIFEKYSIIIRYTILKEWFKTIDLNSYKLIICFSIIINIFPFLSCIYYKTPSKFDLLYILIFIVNQISVFIIINEFFDILYSFKFNKTTSVLIIFFILILPNIFQGFLDINFFTFTELILLLPESGVYSMLFKILLNLIIIGIFKITKSTYIVELKAKDLILR